MNNDKVVRFGDNSDKAKLLNRVARTGYFTRDFVKRQSWFKELEAEGQIEVAANSTKVELVFADRDHRDRSLEKLKARNFSCRPWNPIESPYEYRYPSIIISWDSFEDRPRRDNARRPVVLEELKEAYNKYEKETDVTFLKNCIAEMRRYLSNINFLSRKEIDDIVGKGVSRRDAERVLRQEIQFAEDRLEDLSKNVTEGTDIEDYKGYQLSHTIMRIGDNKPQYFATMVNKTFDKDGKKIMQGHTNPNHRNGWFLSPEDAKKYVDGIELDPSKAQFTEYDVTPVNESEEEFEPFFFKDEDGDFFRDEAQYYIDSLDDKVVTDKLDEYSSFRDFVDNEFSIKVLGSYGNTQEMDELFKYFTIKSPRVTKLGQRVWNECVSESAEGVKKINLPEKVGKWTLCVDTYETLEQNEGHSQEDVDSWYDANGDIAYIYCYTANDGNLGVLAGIQKVDGSLSVYGGGVDSENISEEEFISMMTDKYYLEESVNEGFSKSAYDANTAAMLELKLPEEVAKQKEELNQCKEFEDERVKQTPDKKLKDLKDMELDDESVTGKQEVNDGEVEEVKVVKESVDADDEATEVMLTNALRRNEFYPNKRDGKIVVRDLRAPEAFDIALATLESDSFEVVESEDDGEIKSATLHQVVTLPDSEEVEVRCKINLTLDMLNSELLIMTL